jgi:hypothetical protein
MVAERWGVLVIAADAPVTSTADNARASNGMSRIRLFMGHLLYSTRLFPSCAWSTGPELHPAWPTDRYTTSLSKRFLPFSPPTEAAKHATLRILVQIFGNLEDTATGRP